MYTAKGYHSILEACSIMSVVEAGTFCDCDWSCLPSEEAGDAAQS